MDIITKNFSRRFNFGKEWFDVPCSKTYRETVKTIFDKFEKSENGVELINIDEDICLPLITAFADELNRMYIADSSVPGKMIEMIVHSLNNLSKYKIYTIQFPKKVIPTEIIILKILDDNTLVVCLDQGWQLEFCIYNGSNGIKNHLKLEVKLIGMPIGARFIIER